MSDGKEERSGGPVPVRDLMKPIPPEAEVEGEPRWEGDEIGFERDGVEWSARPAGVGSYGTGDLGAARILAIHFYRQDDPDRPVRESLVPAASFQGLRAEELLTLFERATPIDLDRE